MKNKKVLIIVIVVAIIGLIAGGICFVHFSNEDIKNCKFYTEYLYDYYEDLHGAILNPEDVDARNMESYNMYYNMFVHSYDKLTDKDKAKFESWFIKKYNMTVEEFKNDCLRDNLGQDSSFDWEDYVYQLQRGDIEDIEVVTDSLSQNGDYFYNYSATLKNNTDSTISYIEYTVYVYDRDGNTIAFSRDVWTGSLYSNSTINIDSTISRNTQFINVAVDQSITIDRYY